MTLNNERDILKNYYINVANNLLIIIFHQF